MNALALTRVGSEPAARRAEPERTPRRTSPRGNSRRGALPPPDDRQLIAESRAVLTGRARSFRIAAMALGDEAMDDASLCYAFCRAADDAVDDAPDVEAGRVAIQALSDEAHGRRAPRPLVSGWLRMALRTRIPIPAGWALLDAVATDAGTVRMADDDALLRYAYGVAGTVGLMMCGVLGARDPRAQPYAVQLGIAMQLSNIARDVAEDARLGRVYLPATRLRAHGVDPEAVVAGTAPPAATFAVVTELLDRAEEGYRSAWDGLRYLPMRGRLAVLLALHLYRGIGRAVRRRGPDALRARTVVARPILALLALQAVLGLLHPRAWGILPARPSPSLAPLTGRPGIPKAAG